MPAAFIWTQEIEDEICEAIAGGQSLDEACLAAGMPSDTTVYRRMASDEAFSAKMAKARAAQQHHEADRCVKIAMCSTHETVQSDRLLIDTIKWRAGKLAPKVFGDKVSAELTGANGAPLIPTAIQIIGVTTRPNDQSGTTEEDR